MQAPKQRIYRVHGKILKGKKQVVNKNKREYTFVYSCRSGKVLSAWIADWYGSMTTLGRFLPIASICLLVFKMAGFDQKWFEPTLKLLAGEDIVYVNQAGRKNVRSCEDNGGFVLVHGDQSTERIVLDRFEVNRTKIVRNIAVMDRNNILNWTMKMIEKTIPHMYNYMKNWNIKPNYSRSNLLNDWKEMYRFLSIAKYIEITLFASDTVNVTFRDKNQTFEFTFIITSWYDSRRQYRIEMLSDDNLFQSFNKFFRGNTDPFQISFPHTPPYNGINLLETRNTWSRISN